jgi:hypothetical protein
LILAVMSKQPASGNVPTQSANPCVYKRLLTQLCFLTLNLLQGVVETHNIQSFPRAGTNFNFLPKPGLPLERKVFLTLHVHKIALIPLNYRKRDLRCYHSCIRCERCSGRIHRHVRVGGQKGNCVQDTEHSGSVKEGTMNLFCWSCRRCPRVRPLKLKASKYDF